MNSTAAETTLPAIRIRYRNLSDALVTVTEHEARDPQRPSERYSAECTGCLESKAGDYMPSPVTLRDARTWAGEHATACRALPQPTNDQH